jgi:hypothetical protein
MMADAKHGLDFFEGGVGMFFDVRLKFLGVALAPSSPTGFRRQRPLLGGGQIPVNGTPGQGKTPGRLGFGATALNEFYHPFPQVHRISFHARKLITLCTNFNVKCYRPGLVTVTNLVPSADEATDHQPPEPLGVVACVHVWANAQ